MKLPDPAELLKALIACPSVTPARGAVFDVAEAALVPLGFAVTRTLDGPDPVENLIATRGSGCPHFALAGHLDVVPAGGGWSGDAFEPRVRDGILFGRGACDMKGSVAAFIAAAARVDAGTGTLSILLTGDEEGAGLHGTRAIMHHMAARGLCPDQILVGEPTSAGRLGDTVKIGRRGSVNLWITSIGREGHVAYPAAADNPLPRLIACLAELDALVLDTGTDWFQPSNLELTELTVDNPAHNVIPGEGRARLSIRFNDRHTGAGLVETVRSIAERHGCRADGVVSGEAFLTPPGALSDLVSEEVERVTGVRPTLSTSGGTSDARFLQAIAPVVEFGPPNATMHKRDESIALADLEALTAIYTAIASRALSSTSSVADHRPSDASSMGRAIR